MKFMVGTRGSALALAQTEGVCKQLREAYPEHEFEIKIIRTMGDLIQDRPLDKIGDKGVFVKEIEAQLLSGEIQLGVHSMKDMPACPAPGLDFAKAWEREDPRDVLILREAGSLEELPEGAVIGTGSRRREVQLLKLRPDLRVTGIRGNVDTRIRKMEEQGLDGIVLAAAGLHRLGKRERITCYLDGEKMIPAPAQGVLALEIREDNLLLRELLDALSHGETEITAGAERAFLQQMGADCHLPVGALCRRLEDGRLRLKALYGRAEEPYFYTADVCGRDPRDLAERAAAQIRRQMAGTVLLVGAGPGDPGLITVKGLKAIREADCIVYDRLAAPELLLEAGPACELIYAGKENRRHTMKQEEINRLLTAKAMEYRKVVRLKGGDPYVFGRGGEEALYLKEKGVPFEMIPGVSSCLAGPACAGIPVTHRGVAGGFHVVTAHDRQGALADIDFSAMASGGETCVFLMGLSRIREIAARLLEEGMAPETPAAVISRAATPAQRVCCAELSCLAEVAEKEGMESPALIVVGEVVRLRELLAPAGIPEGTDTAAAPAGIPEGTDTAAAPAGIPEGTDSAAAPAGIPEGTDTAAAPAGIPEGTDAAATPAWEDSDGAAERLISAGKQGKLPLAGRRYLVPVIGGPYREGEQGKEKRLAELLREAGAAADELRVGEIVYRGSGLLREWETWPDWLIFTGRNGVEAFFAGLEENGMEIPGDCKIAAVGRRTEEYLNRHGRRADAVPGAFNGESLAVKLKSLLKGGESVCCCGPEQGDGSLREALSRFCRYEERAVYENRCVEFSPLTADRLSQYDGILFTCASSARRLMGGAQGLDAGLVAGGTHVYSIGPKCTSCLEQLGLRNIRQAAEATYEALAERVLQDVSGE